MKIFCIGFQKTGTTSLGKALGMLGYDVCGPIGVTNPDIDRKALAWAVERVPDYDAFQDNPWPLLYQELDRLYPNSKFILTTRKPRSWLKSMRQYFGNYEAAAESWIYGDGITPLKNPLKCLRRFKRHNREVRQYFKDRPDQLLEIDFSKGHGWNEICEFLGCTVPEQPFPRSNKSGTLEAEAQRHTVGVFATIRLWSGRVWRLFLRCLNVVLPVKIRGV
ncbi:MAG: sulfotransferase [Alphaproteobacteria bacterium]|nr:sulfotransferase [Alphaproteobacteria bacterium]